MNLTFYCNWLWLPENEVKSLEYLGIITLICCLNARILWPTLDKGNHQTYLQANKHHFQQPTYKIQANILVIISISFFVNP